MFAFEALRRILKKKLSKTSSSAHNQHNHILKALKKPPAIEGKTATIDSTG